MKAQGFARTLMAAAISMTMCTAAVAQGAVDHGLTVSVGGVYNLFHDVHSSSNKVAPEIGLGYRFNDRFGLEGSFSWTSTDVLTNTRLQSADLKEYRLDGYMDLTPWDGSFTPYAIAGVSLLQQGFHSSSTNDTRLNLGVGLRKAITPNLSVRGDVRAVRSLDFNKTEGAVNLALTWTFGSVAEPAPVVEPVAEEMVVAEVVEVAILDADNDGIVDASDLCMNTPEGAAVDAVGCEQVEAMVLFDLNSAKLRAEDMPIITEVGQFMQRNDAVSIKVVGYTDSTGSMEYNRKLSLKRADAVLQALVSEFGIDASRIEVSAMGADDPAAPNTTLEGREDNRRVVMISVSPQA